MVKCKTYEDDVERKLLNIKIKSLIEVGLLITADAKLICPVDKGNLRASIHHVLDGSNIVRVGTDIDYSDDVELGTSKQKAQPYLKPAGLGNRNKINKVFKKNYGVM